jgi:hypothetical protein
MSTIAEHLRDLEVMRSALGPDTTVDLNDPLDMALELARILGDTDPQETTT